ncbi:MAG: hypothetical protein FJW23_06625 [Acidimicrobiia bacterium]|nr:hypothetical protein [Acidimicrobiia bacterium]
MASALVTLTTLSVFGLAGSLALAWTATSSSVIDLHVRVAVFSTILNLLAHSLMMFYLLGKGRAVKEAVAEHHVPGTHAQQVARLRGPVFSRATWAMALTMTAAIVGASVDVGVMRAWPHATLAAAAVALNLCALQTEIAALRGTGRVVDEVNAVIAAGS